MMEELCTEGGRDLCKLISQTGTWILLRPLCARRHGPANPPANYTSAQNQAVVMQSVGTIKQIRLISASLNEHLKGWLDVMGRGADRPQSRCDAAQ